VTPEEAFAGERLRRAAQALLDRWYPGTGVVVDWTGERYLLQVTRAGRLASPIWVTPEQVSVGATIALHRELVSAAWRLARARAPDLG
jgi:hypothetical protein